MTRFARLFAILALVAGAYLLNVLEPAEHALTALRYRWSHIAASPNLVLVEIDEPSLREISV